MSTVLTDNSLCTFAVRDDAEPKFIYKYIQSLRDTGIKYAEVDFRVLMKLKKLPRGMGYIFRPIDPMFMKLVDVFDFDYVVLTPSEINRSYSQNRLPENCPPVMLSLSGEMINPGAFTFSQRALHGKITAVRVTDSVVYIDMERTQRHVHRLKSIFPVPIDFCPTNEYKSALDGALKLYRADMDSLTLTMGSPKKYCSLCNFLFTLFALYDDLPRNFSLNELCRAAALQHAVFRDSAAYDEFLRVMEQFEHDARYLVNADTGRRVAARSMFRIDYLKENFVSALEKMKDREDIPDDVFEDLTDAINHFDVSFYNEKRVIGKPRAFLN